MASASPSASMTVVLEVGARFNGHASCSTFTSRSTIAILRESGFGIAAHRDHPAPENARSPAECGAVPRSRRCSSGPARRRHPPPSRDRHGARSSESSTTAGEPVLVRVAAIFSPMCPDFPTPRTITLPRASTRCLDQIDGAGEAFTEPLRGAAGARKFPNQAHVRPFQGSPSIYNCGVRVGARARNCALGSASGRKYEKLFLSILLAALAQRRLRTESG